MNFKNWNNSMLENLINVRYISNILCMYFWFGIIVSVFVDILLNLK